MVVAAVATLALQLAATVAYLDYAVAYMQFPGNEDYGEGPILYQLEWLRSIGTMYFPIAEPPYSVSNYPPIFHLVTWFTTNFFNDPLTAGRVVSLVSTLTAALLIFLLVYTQAGDQHSARARAFGGVLAVSFFLSHYAVTLWSVMARVDMLALAFGLLGILVFFHARRRNSLVLSCLFGLIFVAAAFTKQNMIAAAAATFATALFVERRLAFAGLAVSIPAGLAALTFLHVNSGGEFLLHAFSYNINAFQWERLGQLALVIVALNPVELMILMFGSVYMIVAWKHQREAGPADRKTKPDIPVLLFAGFMAVSLLNVVSSLKQGAAPNYYVEFQAAASLLLGLISVRTIAFMRARQSDPEYHKYALAVVLGLAVLSWQVLYGWENKYRHPYEQIAPNMKRVIELVSSVDGPVISEDMVLLYKSGKPLFYQPFIMRTLTREGRWDDTRLNGMMRRGEVPVIVLTTPIGSRLHQERFTPTFTEILNSRYRLLERFGHFEVYVPSG
jgi:hypothetical protein